MTRKPHLTMDQHCVLAADLRVMENRLTQIISKIERTYPIGSPVQRKTKGLLTKITRLRWALAYETTWDCPEEPSVHDLYSGSEEDKAEDETTLDELRRKTREVQARAFAEMPPEGEEDDGT